MATYVLVHGSWHGGWCWKKVTPLLRAAGHRVYTVTMTGLGDRSHLVNRSVNLSTHITDVANTLFYEDLRDVILVGHSYGTFVVAGAADAMADRVGHLVLFDGSIPENGKALLDIIPAERRELIVDQANREGDGWLMPVPPLSSWGVTDPADVAWMTPRLAPHPLAAPSEPIRLTGAVEAIPTSYILCTRDRDRGYVDKTRATAANRGWGFHTIDSGHDAMVTHPAELAPILLGIPGKA